MFEWFRLFRDCQSDYSNTPLTASWDGYLWTIVCVCLRLCWAQECALQVVPTLQLQQQCACSLLHLLATARHCRPIGADPVRRRRGFSLNPSSPGALTPGKQWHSQESLEAVPTGSGPGGRKGGSPQPCPSLARVLPNNTEIASRKP